MGEPVDLGDGAGRITRDDEPLLSIVIPAYNEEHRLPSALEELGSVFDAGLLDADSTEVLLVDDGSTDATAELARQALSSLPHAAVLKLTHNCGKGAAIRAGVARARGAAVTFLDADMSVNPLLLPDLLSSLADADVVIGSRALDESVVDCRSMRRTLMGRAFNHLVTASTSLGILDTQCGFKGFRSPVARLLFHLSMVDRFAFDVEILLLAQYLGLRIDEVPVDWHLVEGSHIRPVADPLLMVRDLVRTRVGIRYRRPVPMTLAVPPGAKAGAGERSVEAAREVGQVLRATDLVLPWGRGAAVLHPLTSEAERHEMGASLARRLAGWHVTERDISFTQLASVAPLSGRIIPSQPAWGAAPPESRRRRAMAAHPAGEGHWWNRNRNRVGGPAIVAPMATVSDGSEAATAPARTPPAHADPTALPRALHDRMHVESDRGADGHLKRDHRAYGAEDAPRNTGHSQTADCPDA